MVFMERSGDETFVKFPGWENIHYEIFVPTAFKGFSHPGRWSACNYGDEPV
jgi:hypothetical protein